MTSAPVRNPLSDHLLTPQNAAFLLIDCALWTEICMAFTALDALRDGYEVYPLSTRSAAHRPTPTAPASTA